MANIWDEVEEIQEVQNTPQQQPTNDIWGEVEEVSTQPVEQATPVLTGGIEQKVIPNWDKKGRIYYTDEQGNRIKSNVPLSRKIGNKLRATGYNVKDWLTTDVGEKAKERRKAVAMLVTAPLGIGRGIAGMALSGGLGGGIYSGTEQLIDTGKISPMQTLKDTAIGAGLGGALGLGGKYIAKPIINKIAKGKVKVQPQATQAVEEVAEVIPENIASEVTQPKVKPKKIEDIIFEEAKDIDDYEKIFNEEVTSNVGDIASMIGRNSDSNINYSAMRDKLREGGNYYVKTKINPRTLDIQDSDLVQRDNLTRKIPLNEETPPIVVGKDNFVIDGRHRALQAIQDGLDEINAYVPARKYYELKNVQQIEPVKEVLTQPKVNLNTLKSNIRANKFEQGNLKDYMVVNKGKKGYKSTIADPISYDIENSQRDFNKIITEISKNPEKLNEAGYLDELEKRVQEIVDRTPYGETEEVAMPYWEKLWKAVDDGYNYNEFKLNRGNKPQQLDEVAGDIKTRSLPQSVLEAKGTPKEVKEIIKQDIPTYQVMHNQDLIKQATDEIAGNFDNELIRLSSAKDFDALDYEKSRQIAKNLFSMGKYQQAVDLIDNVSENATKKGQAIQALSLWSNMTPEGAVYKAQKLVREYNKKHPKKQIQLTDENIETIANLQQEALNTTDELAKNQALARTAKYTTDLIPKEALQKLKAYRNIAMLLNPKTLMRNTIGNVAFNTIDTGSKGLASLIDRGLSKFTGQRTRVAPQLGDYFKGGLQGAKTGYQEALQGIDTRGLGQRFDLSSGRTFQSKPMQALETALDVGLRTPDRAFYEATFAESVQNMMKAQGLTKPTQEILEQAEREALESVFQNKSMLSDFALGLRGGINRIGTKDFGLGDVLIPYAQTPANLTQQAINYSPLGALKGIYNLSQGNQRQASLDLARSLIGTGLIGSGYGLAKAGLTTPSQFDENYTKNKKIRENLQPLGIRPDQLGDMWYAPFQPMSSPIATGTAMAYGENPLYAGLNTVVDQPYLQGVTRGLRDLQEGDWTKAATNVVASIPSQFVPTLASQLAQSIDPYQRETYDPNKLKYGLNSAIAKVPFASKTLPEKIDVTGQPIERYSTKGGQKLFDIFLNPTFINKKTTDPVLSELKYIYDQTKETSHFMPSVDKKLEFVDVDGNPQKIVLTGREFSEYQRRLGQRMYDEFNYVMDLPEYANADEYGKIKILENAKKLVKAEVDNEMWNKRNRNKKRSYTGGN